MIKKKRIIIGLILTAAILAAVLGFLRHIKLEAGIWKLAVGTEFRVPSSAYEFLIPYPVRGTRYAVPTTTHYSLVLTPIQTNNFYDPSAFQSAFQKRPENALQGQVVAGIVNHHALAQDLIARFFMSLRSADQPIDRIIILSPDHNKQSRSPVTAHVRPYATPQGLAQVDTQFVQNLVKANLVTLDNGPLFENEHGVGALVPFLHHELPEAKVVPLAVRGDAMKDDLQNLGRALSGLLDANTVIIVSSDMSHYLSQTQALEHDEKTLSWLQTSNFFELAKASDDYLDNGASLAILDGVFQELAMHPPFKLLDHSISTRYGADPWNTTSYMTGVWTRL